MTNAVSSKWKMLTDEEKVPFVKMAEQAMKDYRKIKCAFNEKTLQESKLLQATRKRKAEEESSTEKSPKRMHSNQPQVISTFGTSRQAAAPQIPLSISSVGFIPGVRQQEEHAENALQRLPLLSAAYPQQNDPYMRIRFSNQQNLTIPPFLPGTDINQSFLSRSLLQNAATTSQAALLLHMNALEEQAYRRQLVENVQLLQSRQELELANRLRGNSILSQLLANRASDAELLYRRNGVSALEQLLGNSMPNSSNNTDISRNA